MRVLARISHTDVGVTEAKWLTGKEKHAMRSGATDKWFDVLCGACRPKPTQSVSDVSTVCTNYAFHRPPCRVNPPWAMTRRVGVRNAG